MTFSTVYKWIVMENDERLCSTTTRTTTTVSDVPDNWEESTAESSSNKALEAKIIEQAKLKQKQQQQIEVNIQSSSSEMECGTFSPVDVQMAGQGGQVMSQTTQIRILKRPESSGELNRQQQQSPVTTQSTVDETPSSYNNAAPTWQHSGNRKGSGRTNRAMNAIGTKTLEERVTAYAQARERIFGVVDPTVHDDLPLQPKLLPRSTAVSNTTTTQQPPSTTTAEESPSS